jgi:hypothetical protein
VESWTDEVALPLEIESGSSKSNDASEQRSAYPVSMIENPRPIRGKTLFLDSALLKRATSHDTGEHCRSAVLVAPC